MDHNTGNSAKHTVQVEVNERIFKDFALFDIFVRLRRWRPLAVFAAILGVSAILCFAMHSPERNGALLGIILLLIGLGLPLVYVQQFLKSLKTQAKKMGLSKPQHVYTLTLAPAPAGVQVQPRKGETERYAWEELYGAWQRKDAIYLYASSTKAYILPNSCIPCGAETLWELLQEQLPPEKLHPEKAESRTSK